MPAAHDLCPHPNLQNLVRLQKMLPKSRVMSQSFPRRSAILPGLMEEAKAMQVMSENWMNSERNDSMFDRVP